MKRLTGVVGAVAAPPEIEPKVGARKPSAPPKTAVGGGDGISIPIHGSGSGSGIPRNRYKTVSEQPTPWWAVWLLLLMVLLIVLAVVYFCFIKK